MMMMMIMMMMKMKWFLLLPAFLPITPTGTEVVDLVSKCPGFLLKETPPQIPDILENGIVMDQNRYKLICQTFNGEKRFLTLYDTTNRIPVFSAYKFKWIEDDERPSQSWMIEPQLSGGTDRNMMKSEAVCNNVQASDQDYTTTNGYDRGHLYPVCHAPDTDDKKSTFTLTNAVPQDRNLNRGRWRVMEGLIKCMMEDVCINQNGVIEAFVVVGAKPSENNKLNDRVNIPSKLWSAFCCYSSMEKRWVAAAHWAPNTRVYPPTTLQTITVQELNAELSKWKRGFNVFPGEDMCLKATVPDSGQYSDRECQCPPSASSNRPICGMVGKQRRRGRLQHGGWEGQLQRKRVGGWWRVPSCAVIRCVIVQT